MQMGLLGLTPSDRESWLLSTSTARGAAGHRSRRVIAVLMALIPLVALADVAVIRQQGPARQHRHPAATAAAGCATCPAAAPTAPAPPQRPVTRPAPPHPVSPAYRWAVVVGIQDYAGDTHPTFGGRGDTNAVRTALLRSGWRSDHILTLVDGQASGHAINAAMAWLAARSGPDTFSLFHFSGHVCIASRGPCAPGHAYLWSQDNQFLSESTVRTALGRVHGQAWFDFAGCEAGALDAGLSSPTRLVTGSSQASETAYEEPTWHESVWAGLVWDRAFLHGQAGTAPAAATIGQMVAYGRTQAAQLTATQSAGTQHPYVAGGDLTQTLYEPHT
ncbi:MAG: hypothetical protein NVSMB55_02940 [Mycobacteriales bacterium]